MGGKGGGKVVHRVLGGKERGIGNIAMKRKRGQKGGVRGENREGECGYVNEDFPIFEFGCV